MTNVFQDEKTLGEELVRFHRSHAGQPVERFLKFILPKYLLGLMAEEPEPEEPVDTPDSPDTPDEGAETK